MHTHKQLIDPDFLIQPCKQGISFIAPELTREHSICSVNHLMDLPLAVYFYNTDSDFMMANEDCAALVAADSPASMKGKSPATYCNKAFSDKIITIDNETMRSESMRVVEETGSRIDESIIQCMSVKLPIYTDNKVSGLLGFSITTGIDSIKFFSAKMRELINTRLIGQTSLLNADNVSTLTKREQEVLHFLLRGHTAKKIGETLSISRRTVENAIARIKEKTYCRTKAELFSLYKSLLD
jgi:DNA-binding CsgD family transcriptional regulator